jgi:hypothetical protein
LNTNTYIAQLQALGSPERVRAWLFGDWSVISGAYFSEWDPGRHVVAPFPIPEFWARYRYRAFDWGSSRPFACVWLAVASETIVLKSTGKVIPRGCLVQYREWYGAPKGQPNVGLKMSAEEVAAGILYRERDDLPKGKRMRGVADPAMFAQTSGPCIAEKMARLGCVFAQARNMRTSRFGKIGGWAELRTRLKGEDHPMLVIFSTCVDTIRTIPALQHDTHNPEDVDSSGDDHLGDALRYGVMERVSPAKQPSDGRTLDPYGVNEEGVMQINIEELFVESERKQRRRMSLSRGRIQ